MLSACAISDCSISGLPTSWYNDGGMTVTAKFMFEAVPQSERTRYRAFVTDNSRILTYFVEINRHPVRSS